MLLSRKEFTQDYSKEVKDRFFIKLFINIGIVESGALRNPPPGTVVDTDCVHKDWYDFYVVSQSVRQGNFNNRYYSF